MKDEDFSGLEIDKKGRLMSLGLWHVQGVQGGETSSWGQKRFEIWFTVIIVK